MGKTTFQDASENSLILSLAARKEVYKSNAQGTDILYAIYSRLQGSVSKNKWTVLQPRLRTTYDAGKIENMQITYDTTN